MDRKKDEELRSKAIPIPEGKRAVALDICFNDSDPMTDYFHPHRTLEHYVLAIIPDGREDERTLRSVINQIPSLKSIEFKWHSEKWAGGNGNYLKSTTWHEKRPHPDNPSRTVNCHYDIVYHRRGSYRYAIPHPQYFLNTSVPTAESSAANITENREKNGIEIRFNTKPTQTTLDKLKAYGFRWSPYQKLWYRHNTPGLMETLQNLFQSGQL